MALSIAPKFAREYPVENLSRPEMLAITVQAAQSLGWSITFMSANGIIARTGTGMMQWNAEVTIECSDSGLGIRSASTGNELFDRGRNKKTVTTFTDAFERAKAATGAEERALLYESLQLHFAQAEDDLITQPQPGAQQRAGGVLAIFLPVEGYFITPLLLDINILLFIAMAITGVNVITPDTESLIRWGANFKPYTLDGQWWRLVTNCFLHIGMLHLLFNMYALLFIGTILEPYLGKTQFLTAYLLTGIAASITSLWWHDVTVSAGASGAIFGMYGVFLAMLTTNLIEKNTRKAQLGSIGVFVVYNLTYGMRGGVDNAAHIGGLISGLIMGYAFIPSLRKEEAGGLKAATVGLLSAAVIALSVFALTTIPNNTGTYDKQMKAFSALEQSALQVYSLPDSASTEERLAAYREKGLPDWHKAQEIVRGLEGLKLPDVYQKRVRQLDHYCDLRIRGYELSVKILEENSSAYLPELDSTNKEIDQLFGEMEGKEKSN